MKIMPNSADTSEGILSQFVRISYGIFIGHMVLYYKIAWTKTGQLTTILNQAIELSSSLAVSFKTAPKMSMVKKIYFSNYY